MTYYFLDSSALIKRYIPETGTRWVRNLAAPRAGHTLFIAQITPVEVVSGLSRRGREGFLSTSNARAARRLLDRHLDHHYLTINLSGQIMAHAKDLLERKPLRAYDSLQLATALDCHRQFVAIGLQPLVFVSSDTRLLDVARAEGLTVEDPNMHP